jgi:serine protein kinase
MKKDPRQSPPADGPANDSGTPPEKSSSIFTKIKADKQARKEVTLGLDEYLDLCREDRSAYMLIFGRLLKALGEPEIIDTAKDSVLGPIYENKVIKRFPALKDFFGGEKDGGYDVQTQIADHLEAAESGTAMRKKILMLKGPVSGGKSTLAEALKRLAEHEPYYVLRDKTSGKMSPANDSPLCLFDDKKYGKMIESEYGIPRRYLRAQPSTWVQKRIREYGDANGLHESDVHYPDVFDVVRVFPSMEAQRGIASVTAGTANNQDEGDFVGSVDLNKLSQDESLSESDPDVYNYRAGALIRGHQGIVELVEILKLENPKALTCMLDATEEGMFSGIKGVGRFPCDSLILAHLNDSEFIRFKSNPDNVAFISRTNLIEVPYTLRVAEEKKILEKYLAESDYKNYKLAPKTIDLLAEFSVLTRLKPPPENASTISAKMRVYDGQSLKNTDPKAKNLREYREAARKQGDPKEGMVGIDRRIIFDTLSEVFNHNSSRDGEKTADPVQLIAVLRDTITHSPKIGSDEIRANYLALVDGHVKTEYLRHIDRTIRAAALDGADGYAQSRFNQYIEWARAWSQGEDYIDPDTQDPVNVEELDTMMKEQIETPGKVSNPEKFRRSIVHYALEYMLQHDGQTPDWTSSQIFRDAMENVIFSQSKDLLEITAFGPKKTAEAAEDHQSFMKNMLNDGRTPKMVQREVRWWKENRHHLPK